MRLTPVDILANWYNDETLPWSAQKAVNCLAETAEVGGTRSVAKTKGLPGMTLLANLETGAPIRGAEDVEGTLFVVSGTSLFQINPDNSFTNRGNIPGVSLVSMAHNKQGGTTAANELVIANGLSGYVYNTDTTVLSQITDDAFPGATTFDYVDGYISFTDPEGRFWGHSALNQATQYSSIDRYDAESAPDKIISHIVSHREVMVFGTRTTEFFRNTGAATGTFQRVDGTEMEVGIAAPLARARLDNTVYWLGHDGIVYRLAGHSPQRVSNRPIEQAISEFNLANAFAHTWEDRGHKVFYLTFPDGLTFGYDVATSLWHVRETFGLERWGVNTTTRWNGLWVAGDYTNGKLYRLNWDDFTEDGRPLVMECQPGVTHADGNDVLCPYVELFMDTGQSPNPADLDPLQIFGDAPGADVDEPYMYSYTASGGFGIYQFAVASGTLPTGVTLAPNGSLSGVANGVGTFTFTVSVTDSLGNVATLNDTIVIRFTANLVAHKTPNIEILSGVPGDFPLSQAIASNQPTMVATSADGGIIAVSYTSATRIRIFERNSLGGYVEVVTPVDIQPALSTGCIAISRDGTYLAAGFAANFWIYKRQLDGLWDRIQIVTTVSTVKNIKFSPDTNYVAICGLDPRMAVYHRVADVFTLISTAGSNDGQGIAWTKDSAMLAFTPRNGASAVYAITPTTVSFIGGSGVSTAPGNCYNAWSNDELFLYIRGDAAPVMRVYSWNGIALTAHSIPATVPGTGAPVFFDVSADGKCVAASNGSGFMTWDALPTGILQLRANTSTGAYTNTKFAESGDYAT